MMNKIRITLSFIVVALMLFSCSSDNSKKINEIVLGKTTEPENGFDLRNNNKTSDLTLRPSTVLLTGNKKHRLVTVYKEKYNKKGNKKYIDGNYYHRTYSYDSDGYPDYQDDHFMPGIEAVYGFNMQNIAHYNLVTKKKTTLFEEPTLIKTLYYPSLVQDSLNNKPIKRNYYLISVYNEDTNKDSLINHKDLRRLYHFDIEGMNKTLMIPLNYSVRSSEYDSQNDVMYIFAKLDENSNGKQDDIEPIHIFWFELNEPKPAERLY